MATVSLTLPSDGQTIDASDVNNPLNTLAAEINGNLDNSNIKAGAAIDRSKIAGFTDGWESLGYAPTTITALGNRSYTVLVPSVDTTSATCVGQRLKLPRTVTAPTQCTSLNGTTQYYNKTSPSGAAQTDTITVTAWIKPTDYQVGGIMSKTGTAGTNGWRFYLAADGTLNINGAARYAASYQSVPLNKWSHVAATISMSTSTCTFYIDGVLVPSSALTSAGASWTSAGNLEVGRDGGTAYFKGQIAQAAAYSAILPAATIRAAMNQTLTGSETSLVSAYSFNNSINDLSANANNLTANGGALATATDTPFTNSVTGTSVTAGTTNYGIIMAQTFSTNTTYTIQIPEGETLPTTGGIGTVSYSTQKTPYGFPGQKGKWRVLTQTRASQNFTLTAFTWTNVNLNLSVPVGAWNVGYSVCLGMSKTAAASNVSMTLSTGSTTETDTELTAIQYMNATGATTHNTIGRTARDKQLELSASAPYYFNIYTGEGGTHTTTIYGGATYGDGTIFADNAYL